MFTLQTLRIHRVRPTIHHGRVAVWLVAVLLLAQFSGLFTRPQAAVAAPSADASAEIVYIDPGGVIRVLDPSFPVGQAQVQWFSPTGGWRQVVLADVNGDGDMEIVALGGGSGIVRVAVFDPVVAIGATDPTKRINGIPWDTLWETQFFGEPLFVDAGNYDPGIAADEILVGSIDSSGLRNIRIFNADGLGADGKPTGRAWKVHINKFYGVRYTSSVSGDLTANGVDEIILVANTRYPDTYFDVFLPNEDMRPLFSTYTASDNEIRSAAVGNIIPGAKQEIAIGRTGTNITSNTLFVFGLDNNNARRTEWAEPFSPTPQHVFLADLSGNGDKEVFFIRSLSGDDRARLVMVNQWGDDISRLPRIELALDGDNGYRVGAGGDVDGDGKDEIVIMRNNNIRIYTRPDNNVNRQEDILNFPVSSDSTNLVVGDLDKNGFIQGPAFGVNVIRIEANVPVGVVDRSYSFRVSNISTADPLSFRVEIDPAITWLTANPTFTTTPARLNEAVTINLTINTTGLPQTTVQTRITLRATTPNVVNSPFVVELVLNVLAADLRAEPASVVFAYHPCTEPFATTQRTIAIGGTNNLNYRAVVIAVPAEAAAAAGAQIVGGEIDAQGNVVLHEASGNKRTVAVGEVSPSATLSTTWPIDPAVNWITEVSSNVASVPSTITIQADPTILGADFASERALLILVADTRAGTPPDNIRVVPLSIICASERIALPAVVRSVTVR